MKVFAKIGKGFMLMTCVTGLLLLVVVGLHGLYQLLCMIGIYSLILIPLLPIAYLIGHYIDKE